MRSNIISANPALSDALNKQTVPRTILDSEEVRSWVSRYKLIDGGFVKDLVKLIEKRSMDLGSWPVQSDTKVSTPPFLAFNQSNNDDMGCAFDRSQLASPSRCAPAQHSRNGSLRPTQRTIVSRGRNRWLKNLRSRPPSLATRVQPRPRMMTS